MADDSLNPTDFRDNNMIGLGKVDVTDFGKERNYRNKVAEFLEQTQTTYNTLAKQLDEANCDNEEPCGIILINKKDEPKRSKLIFAYSEKHGGILIYYNGDYYVVEDNGDAYKLVKYGELNDFSRDLWSVDVLTLYQNIMVEMQDQVEQALNSDSNNAVVKSLPINRIEDFNFGDRVKYLLYKKDR